MTLPFEPDTALAGAAEAVERFGPVVRALRERRGWSQERLAWQAELNRSYMGEIERGAAMPSLATAAKLAGALDVPLWALLRQCEPAAGATTHAPPIAG